MNDAWTPLERPYRPINTTVIMVHGLGPAVKAAFKAWCAARGLTMKKALIEMVGRHMLLVDQGRPRRRGSGPKERPFRGWVQGSQAKGGGGDLCLRDVPPHFKRRFLIWCVKHGTSMQGTLAGLVRRLVKEQREMEDT